MNLMVVVNWVVILLYLSLTIGALFEPKQSLANKLFVVSSLALPVIVAVVNLLN